MKRYPGGLAILAVGAALVAGCSSSSKKKSNSGGSCKPTAAECYAAGPDGPGNECLAKADNTGSKYQLRVSQLQVASPVTLAAPFMQDSIITRKINFAQPACNQQGEGNFNILFEFDTTAQTLTAGASAPQSLIGAPTKGTCFAKFTDQTSGIDVAPVTVPYTLSGDTYSASLDNWVLPIYIQSTLTSYALLPLHKITVTATLSSNHDCVGKYNADQLDPSSLCATEFPWTNGGSFDAYITVAEADTVDVADLGESLCVLMSGDPATWKGTDAKHTCKGSDQYKNTGKLPTGDWCSTSNSATGCTDSWHLVTKFAASAIKIDDSKFNTCK